MLNFHRERWNPVKKHSKALGFFAVSKQIPIAYSADRGRAEKKIFIPTDHYIFKIEKKKCKRCKNNEIMLKIVFRCSKLHYLYVFWYCC